MSRVVRGPTAFDENGGLLCRDLLFCQGSLPLHRCMGLYRHIERRLATNNFLFKAAINYCHMTRAVCVFKHTT